MNTKTVVFGVNAEYGEVVVDSGALFLGEVAPIEFKGYTPKEGHTLRLTVFNRSPRRDDTLGVETFAIADNSANEGELDLRYEALQKEFSEKCAHAFTMQVNEYEGDRCLPQVIAVGKIVINYSPVVFDPLTGAPATMRGAKGEDGDDGKDLTFDDLTAEQKAELKGEKGEKGDDGDDGKDLSKEVGALELGLEAERGRATSAEGALETRIENLNKTVYEVAGAANTAFHYALEASDKADFIEGKVDTLIDADKGKSARTIAMEESAKNVAELVAGADTNLDTLKEIADFIKNDPYKAAELENKVALLEDAKANKTDIPDVTPYAKKTDVAADIGTAVASEATRAKGAEAELAGRVKELEENGSSVDVVAPSADGDGKAADAAATYEELKSLDDRVYGIRQLAEGTQTDNVLKAYRRELPMVGKTPQGKNVYNGEIVKIENGGFYNVWADCTFLLPCITRKPGNYASKDNPDNGNSLGVPIKFLVRIASASVPSADVIFAEDTGRLMVANTSENSFRTAISAKTLGLNKLWKTVTVNAIPTDIGTEIVHLEVI